ncbi:MAG: trypsin-like peptidase domain-containing protein, partial [Leptolyngbyaceae cyanobacterium bins.302]|nr:trypsin-like peptidase domain-containing protein [Leptolyngbyaceae cyanobacterium bins.302]
MDFLKLLKETEARFHDRTAIRTDQKEKIDAGLPLQADTPERVEKRLKRLGLEPATAKMLVGSDFPIVPSAVDGRERILDTNDLISVNFLERGAIAARSIGRIRVRTGNGQGGFGTGFLVSPRLFLTNNHVLPDAQSAALSRVEFNYQDGADGNLKQPIVFSFQPDVLFITDAKLDYSLVAINPTPQNGTSLSAFGWLPLIEAEGKVIVGESVSIIQHPDGDPKQVALRGNKLVDALPDFLHYETDTAPGSSGSPVFNDQWEVVALHHSGVPKRDPDGKILNVDGLPWAPEQGEHRIAWMANEGVRISRVIQHIKQQPLSATAQALVNEMLNGNSPNVQEMSPSKPEPEESQVTPAELQPQLQSSLDNQDGTVTWTIPLQVSVRLGQPVMQAQPAIVVSTPNISVAPSPAPESEPVPVPATSTIPVFETPDDKDLKAALKDLKGATKKPYYDEKSDRTQRDAYYQTILSKLDSFNEADLY